jgi:hypothetical protein
MPSYVMLKKIRFAILPLCWCVAPYASAVQEPEQLQAFSSDGCSMFPNGTLQEQALWLDCCTAHDRAYWLGGTYQERLKADEDLRLCVADLGQRAVATVMLLGVRVGGSPYWPTSYRWGYGWLYPRGYQTLSSEELQAAARLGKFALEQSETAGNTE